MASDRVDDAIDFAARKLGLDKFKSQQVNALRQFAQGNDIFINLPTGFGKSLIFQGSTVVVDFLKGDRVRGNDNISDCDKSLVIVVLPLKALAVDQGHSSSQRTVFRKCHGQLGELRSILNQSTCVVAMTATATTTMRQQLLTVWG
ncbi:uncharacterized protein LOC119733729 [Patiria miniata]|uniref:DEAD/DEAH-box helicase domain-containing protein n=1 Tax=Patiria miniata TaxID=46514 RepID=A0A914AH40_PATMI|nr:uncharacterized protein LOC119733729 [Patiria miniata]